MNFIWKVKTGRFQSGSSIYLNRIRLGGFEWNGTRSKTGSHEDNDWTGKMILPSLVNATVYSGNEHDIKNKMEKIAQDWFNEALKE